MDKTVISLPFGDFQVVRKAWPIGCVGCWFEANRIDCVRVASFSLCHEFCDFDIFNYQDAILVPNFDPA